MKARLARRQFADLLTWAAKQLDAKPSNPILSCLLIEASEDQVTVSGISDCGDARATLPADVMEPGRIAVSGLMAAQVMSAYKSELVELADANQQLEITADRDVFRLSVFPAHDYPGLAARRNVDGTVEASDLLAAVKQVAKATQYNYKEIGNELWRSGIEFAAEGDQLLVWATDRYRMAARSIPWTPAREHGRLETLMVGSFLEAAVKGLDGTIGLSLAGKTVGVGDQVRSSTIGLIDPGNRIPYKRFPTTGDTEAIVPVAELVDTVRRTTLVTGDGKPKILLGFGGDDITVRAVGADTGAVALNHIDGQHLGGPELQIAFNSGYLLDAFTAANVPDVRVHLTTPTRPAVITAADPEASSYQHVLMPVRL
ncbi:DNA polymerase III subunit beta [Streptomyces sp. SGAir0957]